MSSSLCSLLVRLVFSNCSKESVLSVSREGSGLGSQDSNRMQPGVRQGGQGNFVVTVIY